MIGPGSLPRYRPRALLRRPTLAYRRVRKRSRPRANHAAKATPAPHTEIVLFDHGPAEFPLADVIRCWTEGVQRMKVGGKARLVCPSDLAYGDRGNAEIPGGSTLIFDIELLDIVSPAPRVN